MDANGGLGPRGPRGVRECRVELLNFKTCTAAELSVGEIQTTCNVFDSKCSHFQKTDEI